MYLEIQWAAFVVTFLSTGTARNLEPRLTVLEKKLGLQVYENVLLREELSFVQKRLTDLENRYISGDADVAESCDVALLCEIYSKDSQENQAESIRTVPRITSLLKAFNTEKEERDRLGKKLSVLKSEINRDLITLKSEVERLKTFQQHLEGASLTEKIGQQENEMKNLKSTTLQLNQSIHSVTNTKFEMLETTVQSLQDSMEKKYAVFESSMNQIKQSTSEDIKEIYTYQRNQQVAFSARLSNSVDNLSPWATLVFDGVIYNLGNSYSPQTGEFTAPRNGVYVFYTHILGSSHSLEMCMRKNGSNILYLYVNGLGHGRDGNMIVLDLVKGDKITVNKHGIWGSPPFYVHHSWTTFSGYMLYPL